MKHKNYSYGFLISIKSYDGDELTGKQKDYRCDEAGNVLFYRKYDSTEELIFEDSVTYQKF